jgi:hypothetical protein
MGWGVEGWGTCPAESRIERSGRVEVGGACIKPLCRCQREPQAMGSSGRCSTMRPQPPSRTYPVMVRRLPRPPLAPASARGLA